MIRNLRKSSNFTYVRHVRVFPDSRLARPPMVGADCRQEFNAEGFALNQERQPPLPSFSWSGAFDIIADACAAQAILRGTVATISAIGWILPGRLDRFGRARSGPNQRVRNGAAVCAKCRPLALRGPARGGGLSGPVATKGLNLRPVRVGVDARPAGRRPWQAHFWTVITTFW